MAITPLTKKREIYSDLPMSFAINPVSNDVARKINEESVKESIKNLILTDKGERLFQPNVGCNVRSQLFENYTQQTVDIMKDMVRATINNYEPRCEIISIDISGEIDANEMTITITFAIINTTEPVTLSVVLNRIR